KGVQLDPQRHVNAVFGLGEWGSGGQTDSGEQRDSGEQGGFPEWLAREAGADPSSVLGWELMTHDPAPAGRVGGDGELVSAPRLDNQATCYAGLTALLDVAGDPA